MFLTFAPFLARAGGGIGGGGGGHSSSGGGSHFSSGGSHTFVGGSGFSSGGSGGGGGFAVLFILVPIVVLVLIFVIVGHRKSKHPAKGPGWPQSTGQAWPSATPPGHPAASTTMMPAPARHVARTDAVAAGLAAIRAHDDGFDEDTFLATAERCFFAVEEAWNQQRPELSQPVMAEEAWQRQKAEIDSYRSAGRRSVLDNLTVAKATILAAESDGGHDVVTVRFRAASANYDVDAASGRVVRGNHQMAFWEQDWVFQRSSQATTGGGSANGQRCPNCGAPLDVDIAGVCKNCKASVRGGDADWIVLSAGQAQHVAG
jgi:predicted lipid-binding transport protein (Tim44 family)